MVGPRELEPWRMPQISTQDEFSQIFTDLLTDALHASEMGDHTVALEDRLKLDRLVQHYPDFAETIGRTALIDSTEQ